MTETCLNKLFSGPCIICGATNYSPSYGGPTICPPCDCGDFGKARIERLARQLADTMHENERLLESLHLITGEETSLGMRNRAELAIQSHFDNSSKHSAVDNRCPHCEGEGIVATEHIGCSACDGTGQRTKTPE